MRVQKPLELSRLLLQGTAVNIDSILQKHSVVPINIAVNEQFPIVVWYNPAGMDASGNLIFFEDIYNKFPAKPPTILSKNVRRESPD